MANGFEVNKAVKEIFLNFDTDYLTYNDPGLKKKILEGFDFVENKGTVDEKLDMLFRLCIIEAIKFHLLTADGYNVAGGRYDAIRIWLFITRLISKEIFIDHDALKEFESFSKDYIITKPADLIRAIFNKYCDEIDTHLMYNSSHIFKFKDDANQSKVDEDEDEDDIIKLLRRH